MVKKPAKNVKPAAKKAFTPKQKADAIKERKQDLKDLKAEIIDAKAKNNQDHFAFATGIIGGGGVANFIALQGESPSDLASKTLLTLSMGGLIFGLNKDFFFLNGVYKEMLRYVNAELKNGNDLHLPDFKELFDDSLEIRNQKIKDGETLKSTSYRKNANRAVVFITSIALANLAYKAWQDVLLKREETTLEQGLETGPSQTSKDEEKQFHVFDPSRPAP